MLSPHEQRDFLREVAGIAGVALPEGEIVLPEEGDVVVQTRMRLHYFDWGAPFEGAPDILFCHGGGLTARTWDLVCMQLRDRYRCLTIDMRGHGDSEWSPELDYSSPSLGDDIRGFAEAKGLRNFILIGMSMGGLASISYAGRYPDTLRGLVIVDVGPDVGKEGGRRIQNFVLEGETIGTIEELVERAMKFNPRRSPVLLRRSLLLNLRERFDGKWMWKYDRRRYHVREELRKEGKDITEEQSKLWDDVPNIACPTLVVRGADSDVFSEEQERKLVETLPDATGVVVQNAGHTIQGDNPVGLVQVLNEFFAKRLEGTAVR